MCRESFCVFLRISVCSDQFKFGLVGSSESSVGIASVHFFDLFKWFAGRRALVLILHRISDLNILKRSLASCVHRYLDLNKIISMFVDMLSGVQKKSLFLLQDEESFIFLFLPKKGAMSLTLFFGWTLHIARSRLVGCFVLWTILFWSCPIMDNGRTACAETFLISTLDLYLIKENFCVFLSKITFSFMPKLGTYAAAANVLAFFYVWGDTLSTPFAFVVAARAELFSPLFVSADGHVSLLISIWLENLTFWVVFTQFTINFWSDTL